MFQLNVVLYTFNNGKVLVSRHPSRTTANNDDEMAVAQSLLYDKKVPMIGNTLKVLCLINKTNILKLSVVKKL